MKTGIYPEDIVVAYAARALERPVQWQAERSEEFLSALARPRRQQPRRARARRATARCSRCACARSPTSAPTRRRAGVVIQLLIGPWVSTSIYDIPTIDLHLQRGADQHDADRRLPRRRPARGDLHHRAADRRGGARDEARPGRAAPPQHDPARADAVHEPDGADLRQRRVREDPRPGPRARRLERLRGAARRVEGARPAARPRHRDLPRMDRRQRVRGEGHASTSRPTASSRSSRRRRRWARASRPAMRSSRSTCSACRSSKIRIVQGDTDRGNGFGSAGSRSLFTGGSAVQVASERTVDAGARRSPARRSRRRAADIEYRAGRFAVVGTDRRHRPVRARRQAAGASASISTRRAPVGGRPGRTAATSARSRSTPTPATSRSSRTASVNDIGRVVSPMIVARPGRRRRGAGHRPGAVRAGRLRRAAAASCSPAASWTTRCRAPTRRRLPHRVRHVDPVPDSTRSASRASASSARSARRRRSSTPSSTRSTTPASAAAPRRCRCRRRPSAVWQMLRSRSP